jgi:hypothetical protein
MSDEETSANETEDQQENSSQEEETPAAEEQESSEEKFDEAKAKAALSKKNSEAANLRKRLKELEPLAKKAKELEDEQKSESELTEAKTTAEKEAAEVGREAARLRVALKKGLTETQAKRLVGDNEEELEADADELLASFKPAQEESREDETEEQQEPPRRPRERMKPGAVRSAEPDETDPAKLAADVPRGY